MSDSSIHRKNTQQNDSASHSEGEGRVKEAET